MPELITKCKLLFLNSHKTLVLYAFFGIAIPLFLTQLLLGSESIKWVLSLQEASEGTADQSDYFKLFDQFVAFLNKYVLVYLISFFIAAWSYLGMLRRIQFNSTTQQHPNLTRSTFRFVFGSIMYLLFVSILGFSSILTVGMIVLFVAFPVIITKNPTKGVFSAILETLSMKYVSGGWGERFHLFNQLLILISIVFFSHYLYSYTVSGIADYYQDLPLPSSNIRIGVLIGFFDIIFLVPASIFLAVTSIALLSDAENKGRTIQQGV